MFRCCLSRTQAVVAQAARPFSLSATAARKVDVTVDPETKEVTIPPYVEKENEALNVKRARLLWQSRKRGMLENGLLLSTFADKYLASMSERQLRDYDRLINLPSNDWDIYYWAVGVREIPSEFDNEIMRMFRAHVSNVNREKRLVQPDLPTR